MRFIRKLGVSIGLCWLGLLSLTSAQHLAITPSESSVTKFINESYFVTCQPAEGLKADWYSPTQQRFDNNLQNRIRVEQGFGTDLFLTRITSQDAGVYQCVTPKGRISFNLTVLRPIIFDTNMAQQSATEGRDFVMRCYAQSHGKPRIYWKIDNSNPEGPKYRVTLENQLLIANVTRADGRRSYVCGAMDMDSPVPQNKTMNITLKVKTKPRLINGLRTDYWGVLGEWANVTCAVHAEPKAKFEWINPAHELRPDESIVLNPQDNISILQVLIRSKARFGQYTCRAKNDQGTIEKTMFLHHGKKPATPLLETDVVAHDGARIKVTVQDYIKRPPGNPAHDEGKILPIIGYVVQYKMMTRSDWKPANATKYEEGFVIRGLSPGITYQVRAASKNRASVGEYSVPITVITSKHTGWSINSSPYNPYPDSLKSFFGY